MILAASMDLCWIFHRQIRGRRRGIRQSHQKPGRGRYPLDPRPDARASQCQQHDVHLQPHDERAVAARRLADPDRAWQVDYQAPMSQLLDAYSRAQIIVKFP